jgi:Flp pilus assembly protein TadG
MVSQRAMKSAGHIAKSLAPRAEGWTRGRAASKRERIAGDKRFQTGLTILEMLVSTTLLALIILGLTAMFVQTQKAFKTGIKQNDVTDAGRTITDMIARDLSQISDAQNPGITNLFWEWFPNNTLLQKVQSGFTTEYVTNQLEEIYFLVHTNTTWMGVGYVVINQAPGVGSLYRYLVMTNSTPQVFSNSLFYSQTGAPMFWNVMTSANLAAEVTNSPYFNLIADGVVHLRIRAYDQNGNEPWIENAAENAENGFLPLISYPLAGTNYLSVSNALPNLIELEVGVLEPDTYTQAKSLFTPVNPYVQSNFMFNAAGQTHIFRQQILVPGVER